MSEARAAAKPDIERNTADNRKVTDDLIPETDLNTADCLSHNEGVSANPERERNTAA
ncbi:MAG: hypothetical protein KA369_08360 [Spirochaetes bacterium]|nr:hypothetical protein [Spirochaetota bacterium]